MKKGRSKHKIIVLLEEVCCFSSRAGRLDDIAMLFKYTKETLHIYSPTVLVEERKSFRFTKIILQTLPEPNCD